VRLHLIADVPVGAFLSGGLDSSVMVESAARNLAEPIQTFSIGFEEDSFSELPYAREVARRCSTRHTEQVVTADAVTLLDDLAYHYDEPFADSSAIPTFLVSRLASRHVKVVLSGDGGDEAFGGYARYPHDLREAALRNLLPRWLRHGVAGPLGRVWPKADWLPRPVRLKTALTNLALDPASAYANTLAICRAPVRRRLLAPDVARTLNGYEPEQLVRDTFAAHACGDALSGMLAADVETLLPDDFLVKVDRASMAHGLEVRPPFLDHELLELAGRIPSRFKIQSGQTKWILKQVFRDRLPATALWRPKQGFEIPVDDWLRGPLHGVFADTVLSTTAPISKWINLPVARQLSDAHRMRMGRHGNVLWSLLMLAAWARRHLQLP
jgi:asparagine synthase (glutamine-hydrolysing)